MVVVVTRDVAGRFRGFLASVMLEVAPGVYTGPRMTKAVRERVWAVLCGWFEASGGEGSIVMTWRDNTLAAGQGLSVLGVPSKDLHDHDGILLVRKDL